MGQIIDGLAAFPRASRAKLESGSAGSNALAEEGIGEQTSQ